jgi:sulfate/thiosulfate transport system substrate-binding protein
MLLNLANSLVSEVNETDGTDRTDRSIGFRSLALASLLCAWLLAPEIKAREITLLNVSYDPTRAFYQQFNQAFARHWLAETGDKVVVYQSHGGSGKQGRSVIDGLRADVVTLALAYDIDVIAEKARILPTHWQSRLPHQSSPYTSTIIFLVRAGNPKGIKNWNDLIRSGVSVITPNPRTSGSARWNHLAAWGFALRRSNGNEASARHFLQQLYGNVPVLDTGSRIATTTFVERGIGDVLINWESEILLGAKERSRGRFETVIPSESILTEPAVAWIDETTQKRGTQAVAKKYLEYLYSDEGQEIIAQNFFRPISQKVASKYAGQFPQLTLFTLGEVAGDWRKAHEKHFAEGGLFDQIQQENR